MIRNLGMNSFGKKRGTASFAGRGKFQQSGKRESRESDTGEGGSGKNYHYILSGSRTNRELLRDGEVFVGKDS